VELAWSVVQPIIDAWASQAPTDFPNYAAGTWGPRATDELIARDGHGRKWCEDCADEHARTAGSGK